MSGDGGGASIATCSTARRARVRKLLIYSSDRLSSIDPSCGHGKRQEVPVEGFGRRTVIVIACNEVADDFAGAADLAALGPRQRTSAIVRSKSSRARSRAFQVRVRLPDSLARAARATSVPMLPSCAMSDSFEPRASGCLAMEEHLRSGVGWVDTRPFPGGRLSQSTCS